MLTHSKKETCTFVVVVSVVIITVIIVINVVWPQYSNNMLNDQCLMIIVSYSCNG